MFSSSVVTDGTGAPTVNGDRKMSFYTTRLSTINTDRERRSMGRRGEDI